MRAQRSPRWRWMRHVVARLVCNPPRCAAARRASRGLMTRFSSRTAVLAVASNADARTHRVHHASAAQDHAAVFAGAHNSVTDQNSTSSSAPSTPRKNGEPTSGHAEQSRFRLSSLRDRARRAQSRRRRVRIDRMIRCSRPHGRELFARSPRTAWSWLTLAGSSHACLALWQLELTLFMRDFGVNPAQNRTVDEVKNERRHCRLRAERQREQAMAGQRHEDDHHRKPG